MPALKLNNLSVDDYLQIERESGQKYEYHDGFIVEMAGGSIPHNRISGNIFNALTNALDAKGSDCEPMNSDQKIYIEANRRYLYADCLVLCEDPEIVKGQAVTNPVLIVEVLSGSTADYDRGKKFSFYRKITSLQEFILISQQEYAVEIFTRHRDLWGIRRVTGLDAEIELERLGVKIPLRQIYRRVTLVES